MTLVMSIVVSLIIELNCVGHAVLPPLSINCVPLSAFPFAIGMQYGTFI